MNCDEFISAIEMGNDTQRNAARQHAESCSACAATLVILQEIKTALTDHEPLPASARSSWENASRVPRPQSRSSSGWMVLPTVAATIAVCLVFALFRLRPSPPSIATNSFGNTTVIVPNMTAELTELSSATDALEDTLNALSEQVDRMELDQEIQVTLRRFDRW